MTIREIQANAELMAKYASEINRPFFRDVLIPAIRDELLRPITLSGAVTEETAAYPHGINVGSWRTFDAFVNLNRIAPASQEPAVDYGATAAQQQAEQHRKGQE